MTKQRLNLNVCLSKSEPASALPRDERGYWNLAGVRSREQYERLGQVQLLSRYDPLETQRMLDMAG